MRRCSWTPWASTRPPSALRVAPLDDGSSSEGLGTPQVAPPAVTTLIDALGIVLYLSIAQAVLGDATADAGHRGEL